MEIPFTSQESLLVNNVDAILDRVTQESVFENILRMSYTALHSMGVPGYEQPFLIDQYIHLNEYETREAISEMHRLTLKHLSVTSKNHGFPPGNWYMLTITQHTKDDYLAILNLHEKTMSWLKFKGIEAHSAAIEKAAAYHVHYAIRIPGPKTNIARDLARHLDGRRVSIEKRVNTLKQWNGLHKYISKDGYSEDKAGTQVELLFSNITKTPGKGWVLNDK